MRPARRTAAAESPPPTTEKAPAAVISAAASAMANVPAAKRGSSNRPMGPFQKSEAQPRISSAYRAREAGPISSAAIPGPIASTPHVRDRSAGIRRPLCDRHVDRQPDPVRTRGQDRAGEFQGGLLDERRPGLHPLRPQEGVRHGAADKDTVGALQKPAHEIYLVTDLRSPESDHEGTRRVPEGIKRGEFPFHQQAGGGRAEACRHPGGRRVRAVERPERVVDEEVAEAGQPPGQGAVVRRFPGQEARVLEEENPAGCEPATRAERRSAVARGGEVHLDAEQAGEDRGHRRERERGVRTPPGAAEVREQDRPGVVPQQPPQRGQRGLDSGRVGHPVRLERDIVVYAHERSLPGRIGREIREGPDHSSDSGRFRPRRPRAAALRQSSPDPRSGSSSPTRCRTRR